jgi:arginine deiminase
LYQTLVQLRLPARRRDSGGGGIVLRIASEVGRLRRVLCHEPGFEVDGMIPDMMEELLFDDILHGEEARQEHAQIRRVLEILGVEVLESEDLLGDILEQEEARAWIRANILEGAPEPVLAIHDDGDQEALRNLLIRGYRLESPHEAALMHELYALRPLPNLCFQRDPQVVIGDSVAICTMSTPAREREAWLAEAVFRFHPHFASAHRLIAPSQAVTPQARNAALEGGDVLVLSKDVVAIGYSQRTNRAGIQWLADALADVEEGPRWMVVVEVPPKRAFMHLDTLFTPVDVDACLIYPPVIERDGPLNAGVFLIDLRRKERAFISRPDLLSTLRELGIDYEPIACGGDDPVAQQREQWTDGANAMALAPGVIMTYNRNHATAAELDRKGFQLMDAMDLLVGKAQLDPVAEERTAILLASNELSRARGGPHCLLHSLQRDDL